MIVNWSWSLKKMIRIFSIFSYLNHNYFMKLYSLDSLDGSWGGGFLWSSLFDHKCQAAASWVSTWMGDWLGKITCCDFIPSFFPFFFLTKCTYTLRTIRHTPPSLCTASFNRGGIWSQYMDAKTNTIFGMEASLWTRRLQTAQNINKNDFLIKS